MLDNRLVLVTGGISGLGRGVLAALRDEGATVVTTTHRPQSVDDTHVEVADLLTPGEARPLIERVIATHGRIDALVCLVGGFIGGSFIQTDNHTWNEIVELNVSAAASAISAALPQMTERGFGRIVIVSSKPALDPSPNAGAQAAAKDSVIALTRSTGRELRGSGVTANCILTGTIDTPANRELLPRADPTAWVTPEQIGQVVAFLCSEAAGVIRGAAIPVHGDQ